MEESKFYDVNALYRPFIKILKVNLTDESYSIIKVRKEEKTEAYGFSRKISEWFLGFEEKGWVAEEDRGEFRTKTELSYLREYFEKNNKSLSVRYRRREKDGFSWVCMEFVRASEYQSSRQYVYLYVKSLEKQEAFLGGGAEDNMEEYGNRIRKNALWGQLISLVAAGAVIVELLVKAVYCTSIAGQNVFLQAGTMDYRFFLCESSVWVLFLLFFLHNIHLTRKLLKNLVWQKKCLAAALQDIEKHRKKEIEFIYMSETDCLTGIANRSAEHRISQLIEKRIPGMFCLFDADKFKHINDTFGHQTGDKVLIAIADCMRWSFKEDDVIFRLGGDEFGVYVLGVTRRDEGEELVNRFFAAVEKLSLPEMKGEKFHLSMGAAFYTGKKKEAFLHLYRRADSGCYISKGKYGSQCTFVDVAEAASEP